ncbi:MAG: EVE domain-containing protein [Ignavibacteriaceae bacterium]
MNRHWLFKTDPAEYSFLMLLEDKEYTWSNVSNIMEKKGIRNISKGDTIAFFHSGDEKKIIGTAEAVTNSYKKDEPNSSKIVIDIKPVKQLERPVALWELKLNPKFRNFDLLNIPELNIFSVNDEQWDEILIMSEGKV